MSLLDAIAPLSPALDAATAALKLAAQRNAEENSPAVLLGLAAQTQQADWDQIAKDIAAGDVKAEQEESS